MNNDVINNINDIVIVIKIPRLTQRASETMASAALALFALRLIMTAAVAMDAMIEMIREQIIRMASGLALESALQLPSV